jgi:hypothetical protein
VQLQHQIPAQTPRPASDSPAGLGLPPGRAPLFVRPPYSSQGVWRASLARRCVPPAHRRAVFPTPIGGSRALRFQASISSVALLGVAAPDSIGQEALGPHPATSNRRSRHKDLVGTNGRRRLRLAPVR